MVYTLLGDGECNEGQVWEAAQAANKYRLDNLVVIVDNNRLQNDGPAEQVMPTEDLAGKFAAFGFETTRINGHKMEEIVTTLEAMKASRNGKPKCIVCNTVKGRGVSFMENVAKWHGIAPDEAEYAQAMREVEEGLR